MAMVSTPRWIQAIFLMFSILSLGFGVYIRRFVLQLDQMEREPEVRLPGDAPLTWKQPKYHLYPADSKNPLEMASAQTLQKVEGRWQVIERWVQGVQAYSWSKAQAQGIYDLEVMVIEQNLMLHRRRYIGDPDDQPVVSWKRTDEINAQTGRPVYQKVIDGSIVAFDGAGPGTFLANSIYSDLESEDFQSTLYYTPQGMLEGRCDRGIYIVENDQLLIYWVDEQGLRIDVYSEHEL